MTSTASGAEQAVRSARDSTTVELAARLGLAARGLVWLVLGLLALALAGGRNAQADQEGALRALRDTPFGELLLVALAVGFVGYAAWLLLEAAAGHRGDDHRAAHRAESAFKASVYLVLTAGTVQFLARGSTGQEPTSRTAELMSRTGGRSVVAVIGLVVLGIGVYMAVKGLRRQHAECLEDYRVPSLLRGPAIAAGAVGYVGRGVTLGLVGAFLARAAVQFDPQQAKGLDAALQTVAQQPYGRVLLAVMAISLLAFALWSFIEAAFRKI